MIQIRPTHPDYPADAAAEAAQCLNKAGVYYRVDGDRISILESDQFHRASEELKSAGFGYANVLVPPGRRRLVGNGSQLSSRPLARYFFYSAKFGTRL